MVQKIRPLNDRVFIKRLESEEMTESGLFIPASAQEKTQTGEVLAVGGGRKDTSGAVLPLEVKVGDMVYFGKYAGTEVDKDHLIIREDEILGVVER